MILYGASGIPWPGCRGFPSYIGISVRAGRRGFGFRKNSGCTGNVTAVASTAKKSAFTAYLRIITVATALMCDLYSDEAVLSRVWKSDPGKYPAGGGIRFPSCTKVLSKESSTQGCVASNTVFEEIVSYYDPRKERSHEKVSVYRRLDYNNPCLAISGQWYGYCCEIPNRLVLRPPNISPSQKKGDYVFTKNSKK